MSPTFPELLRRDPLTVAKQMHFELFASGNKLTRLRRHLDLFCNHQVILRLSWRT
jgi:hypothetical protein